MSRFWTRCDDSSCLVSGPDATVDVSFLDQMYEYVSFLDQIDVLYEYVSFLVQMYEYVSFLDQMYEYVSFLDQIDVRVCLVSGPDVRVCLFSGPDVRVQYVDKSNVQYMMLHPLQLLQARELRGDSDYFWFRVQFFYFFDIFKISFFCMYVQG